MARPNRPNKHRLTCDIGRDIIEDLDSIVEQDVRFWNRTHLINEALRMYVVQWEDDREDEPVEDASVPDDDDGQDDEDDQGDQGDLFDQNDGEDDD